MGYHNSALGESEFMTQLKVCNLLINQFHSYIGRFPFNMNQLLWVTFPIYNASLCLTKLSILFQYLRIFTIRNFRIVCYIVLAVVVAFFLWTVIGGFLTCYPVAFFWDPSVHGSCLDFKAVWLFNAAMHIVTDLTVLVLPMHPLKQLHLPKGQKIGLMIMLSMGGL